MLLLLCSLKNGHIKCIKRLSGVWRAVLSYNHPQWPRGSRLGREMPCTESFQAKAFSFILLFLPTQLTVPGSPRISSNIWKGKTNKQTTQTFYSSSSRREQEIKGQHHEDTAILYVNSVKHHYLGSVYMEVGDPR